MAELHEKAVVRISPTEWLYRLNERIADIDLRLWCASIIFWDFCHYQMPPHAELFVLEGIIADYDYNHNATEEQLLQALARIDYPNPERRLGAKLLHRDEGD